MSEPTSRAASTSNSPLTAVSAILALFAAGALGWCYMLHQQTRSLEKRITAVESRLPKPEETPRKRGKAAAAATTTAPATAPVQK